MRPSILYNTFLFWNLKLIMIKILFIGDICGKPGRTTLKQILPELRKQENVDIVITNIENSAHGRGATPQTVNEIMEAGVDFMTAGNHIWRRKEFHELLSGDYPIIRCQNYPEDLPGKGYAEIDLGEKGKLLVASFLGWSGMNERTITEPFRSFDDFYKEINPADYSGIVVEFHAEMTSEKLVFPLYLDGKVSAVLGTHTHIPTADERILPGGTAYINDVGMVGPLNSALWVKKDIIFQQSKYPYSPAYEIEEEGSMRFDAVVVEIENATKSTSIHRVNKIIQIS
jgi:metallophosphoesterase (TIGR00282 family)